MAITVRYEFRRECKYRSLDVGVSETVRGDNDDEVKRNRADFIIGGGA